MHMTGGVVRCELSMGTVARQNDCQRSCDVTVYLSVATTSLYEVEIV